MSHGQSVHEDIKHYASPLLLLFSVVSRNWQDRFSTADHLRHKTARALSSRRFPDTTLGCSKQLKSRPVIRVGPIGPLAYALLGGPERFGRSCASCQRTVKPCHYFC